MRLWGYHDELEYCEYVYRNFWWSAPKPESEKFELLVW